MMKHFAMVLTSLVAVSASAQQVSKPVIDSSVFDRWLQVGAVQAITNNGEYVYYFNKNVPPANQFEYVLQSTKTSWKKQYQKYSMCYFTADSKTAILGGTDSVCFLRLGTEEKTWLPGVSNFNVFSCKEKDWLIYTLTDSADKNALHIRNLKTKKESTLPAVDSYEFFPRSGSLLLIPPAPENGAGILYGWWNLSANRMEDTFRVKKQINFRFDVNSETLCFLSESADGSRVFSYVKKGMRQPEIVFDSRQMMKNDPELVIDENSPAECSKDGQYLFFTIKEKALPQNADDKIKINLWSYTDKALQSQQFAVPHQYRCAVSVDNKQWMQLENDSIRLETQPNEVPASGFVLVGPPFGSKEWWQDRSGVQEYLVSLRDGSKTLINKNTPLSNDKQYDLSPEGQYVIYYDADAKNYFSYSIREKITRNITQAVHASWIRTDLDQNAVASPEGVAGWLPHDEALLIYDEYDIWKVDPAGQHPAVNLTGGYGAAHHLRFRRMRSNDDNGKAPVIADREQLILFAFDTRTKYSGFYRQALNGTTGPQLLHWGPYAYTHVIMGIQNAVGYTKAPANPVWIIKRESTADAPNLFVTRDFKTFQALSDIHPEKNYNWITSELVHWRMPDGRDNQGILYKPENFDPAKKYPLIFNYYEVRADELYEYKIPGAMTDNVNIPWFVSRGYLVFIPNILYTKPTVGESAVNTVVSAAHYLCRNPWVDSSRMGIQGHSFGGEETNYLVAHTHLFAAACEAAGPTDALSGYGELRGFGPNMYKESGHRLYEISQGRIRASITERPDLYIDETVVFHANKVTTPLLMMHNKNDANVSWMQAMEFFTVLRRMGKRVWLMEYEGRGHALNGAKPQMSDYTIRMTQFFDHYLKGSPPPKWMTRGIDARHKGLDYGYELDLSGKEPQEFPVLYKGKIQIVKE